MLKKLTRDFYKRNTLLVAEELIGKIIVRNICGKTLKVMISETEAYIGPLDKAAHTYNNRRTKRNEVVYGQEGHLYVYLIYGMYYCMNIVTAEINKGECVLIRGALPYSDYDDISLYRFNKKYESLTRYEKKNLLNGPGKLCKALSIDKKNNGIDLLENEIYLEEDSDSSPLHIKTGKRINIDYSEEAADYPWRFYL